jgi:hypothetical protein
MATIGVVSSALSDHEHQVQLRRAVIASTIGTAIEWYDFFLYSVVTGLVFAKLFFPNSDPLVGTLEAFGLLKSWSLRQTRSGLVRPSRLDSIDPL